MLIELRKVIPEFLKRVDVAERGLAWSSYWQANHERVDALTARVLADVKPETREEVKLVDHDPEGELKVMAAVLYAAERPARRPIAVARAVDDARSSGPRSSVPASVTAGTVATSPDARGSAPGYRFDVLCDYGAFRDLQRHRPLTIEWQRLTTEHGFETPSQIDEAGLRSDWDRVMEASARMERELLDAGLAGRGAVRGVHGLSHPIRDADDGARGDAPHRAALPACRSPRLPTRGTGDAPGDRPGAPRDRRDLHAT